MTFIQAANYYTGRLRPIRLICLHDMEAPEGATTAEGVARFFHNQPKGPNGSSAHVCVDNDSAVGCVRAGDTAWAAPGANADGLHIEQAGYARQTRSQWLDPYSRAVIKRAAHIAANWCHEHNLRPQMLTDTELRNGKATGVTTHLQVTRVLNGGVGHTDPGDHYPVDLFMADLEAEMRRFDPPGPFTDAHRKLVDDATGFLNGRKRGPADADRKRVVLLRDAANNLLGRD